MKVYLVGGAVRDSLLGREVTECDYVVVGSNEEEMKRLGYKCVGQDFPVFLHPETKEEYALARKERKVSSGYHGFTFDSNQSVTLEEDLFRRDLTINAIAKDEHGKLIDPYNGISDIKEKVLRHISDAFSEDPVRVLRVARFYARFYLLGFRVAQETKSLMYQMVKSGEVSSLVSERVWLETLKALKEPAPEKYFELLRETGALGVIFPEIEALYGVPQTQKWHGEIDTGIHTMMVLKEASRISDNPIVRFAALTHDFGKAKTPVINWPSHFGHEIKGETPIKTLCKRLAVPNAYKELALLVAKFHTHIHKIRELSVKRLVKLFDELDVYRKPQRFRQLLSACHADANGRIMKEKIAYTQIDYALEAYKQISSVSFASLSDSEQLTGPEIKAALMKKRVSVLEQWLEDEHE